MPLVHIFRRSTTWFRVVPAILLMLSNGSIASTGSDGARSKTYVGVYAGSAKTENRLIDVDGFANWAIQVGFPIRRFRIFRWCDDRE